MPDRICLKKFPIAIPLLCACCAQPEPNSKMPFSYSHGTQKVTYFSVAVPYCATCLEHVRSLKFPGEYAYLWIFGELFVVLALMFEGYKTESSTGKTLLSYAILLLLILAPILWSHWYSKKRHAFVRKHLMKPTCCKEGYAVRFGSGSVLTVYNKIFADHLKDLNQHGQIEVLASPVLIEAEMAALEAENAAEKDGKQ